MSEEKNIPYKIYLEESEMPKQWYVIPLLPFFNLMVFFMRFAGVINSINTDSAWKTKNFTQERESFVKTVRDDFGILTGFLGKIRDFVNNEE